LRIADCGFKGTGKLNFRVSQIRNPQSAIRNRKGE